jgi:hypothetical protein
MTVCLFLNPPLDLFIFSRLLAHSFVTFFIIISFLPLDLFTFFRLLAHVKSLHFPLALGTLP